MYSYCTRHQRKVARECQFSGKRVWAIGWGYVCAAQLLGPYVAIPGSRQSDDVAARHAGGQMRFPGAGWGICVSPTGGPQGQLQTCLVRDWDVDLSGSSPRLCGRKTSRQPTVTTPWRASL